MNCACGSERNLNACCGPYIERKSKPETAEKLMRSRYTAYTLADIGYIEHTLAPESRSDFDKAGALSWAKKSEWKGLKIISTDKGTAADSEGVVEFVATYGQEGQFIDHHEISSFRKDETGQWYFVDGHAPGKKTVRRENPKIGRNDPCHCGSGKKFKKCCG
jgi:SEC-C motif domain protein